MKEYTGKTLLCSAVWRLCISTCEHGTQSPARARPPRMWMCPAPPRPHARDTRDARRREPRAATRAILCYNTKPYFPRAYNWANITLNFRVRGRQENARSSHTPREESHTTHASGGHGARASGISRSRSLPVRHRQPTTLNPPGPKRRLRQNGACERGPPL